MSPSLVPEFTKHSDVLDTYFKAHPNITPDNAVFQLLIIEQCVVLYTSKNSKSLAESIVEFKEVVLAFEARQIVEKNKYITKLLSFYQRLIKQLEKEYATEKERANLQHSNIETIQDPKNQFASTIKWLGKPNALFKLSKRLKEQGMIASTQEFEAAMKGTAGQTVKCNPAKINELTYLLSILYQNKAIKSDDGKAIWSLLSATIVDFSNSPIKSDLKRYSYKVRKDAKDGNNCYNWIRPFLRSIRLIG